MLAQLGDDAPTVLKEARYLIDDFVAKQDDLLTYLRVQAGMYDVVKDPTPLLAIQKAMISKVRLQRAWDVLKINLGNIENAAESAHDMFTADPSLEPLNAGPSRPKWSDPE